MYSYGISGKGEGGFTLVEVIFAIVFAVILASLTYQFLGAYVVKSGTPLLRLKDDFELSEVMERITADYRSALKQESLDDSFFNDRNTASEINALYGSQIEGVSIVATSFQLDGSGSFYVETGSDATIKKVTLSKGGRTLTTLFTQ